MRQLAPLLILCLIAPAAGGAEATGAEPDEAPSLTTFYGTATVRERPVTSATSAVTVLDRAAIEATGARTLSELLRFVPGLDITTGVARGSLATAQIRGGDPNYTRVLLDGIPLNDGTYQVGDVFDLTGLPVLAIERLEVVRGPLSSFYGSTGLAGAINIITRRGQSASSGIELAEGELEGGDASLRRAGASLAGGSDRAAYFVGLSWEEESERVADESFSHGALHANLDLRLGPTSRLRLSSRFADWDAEDYPDASGGPVFGSGELRDAQHSELSLGAELLLGKDGYHKVTASVYHHALDRTSPAVFPLVPPSIEATDFTRSRLGWSGTLHSGEHLRLAVGADLDREEGENRSLLFLPPFLGGDVPGDYRLVRTTPGAFAELLIERGDLLFEIGSRLDFPEDTSAQWSPRLGIRYQLGDDGSTRLRASAGRAFKLPSFFALASPPQLGGNPDLRPETSLGADLGIEHSFGGNADSRPIDAGLTLFYSRYENLVDFDFETFSHVNRSEVEARGVESYLTWRPDARFALRLNLTWQEVKNIGSDARLRHRPRWVGGLRLTWTPRPTLRFELSSQGVSESFDEQIPVTDRFTTSGYQLLALSGSWKLASSWELRGRVDNLADKNYETLIGFPGPGRALRLGLRYHLGGRQDP